MFVNSNTYVIRGNVYHPMGGDKISLIEFYGEQHYKYVKLGNSLKNNEITLIRDKIKQE